MDIKKTAEEIHQMSKEKGWWDGGPRSLGDQFSNFHSELSEAWEEYRKGKAIDEIYFVDGKPEGLPIELADTIIRILDTCEAYNIDIAEAIKIKIGYNKNRPYRHGNKKA